MAFSDRTLVCRDCGKEFIFTSGEQEFFAQKGLENEPSRCPVCRATRKRDRGDGGARGPRQLYDVVCANCNKPTQVPFQPRNGRPVYCRDCFEQMQPRQAKRY